MTTEPTPDDEAAARELIDNVLTPLQENMIEAATAVRNIYLAYLHTGFTPAQALHLTAEVVAVSTRFGLERGAS